MNDEDKTKEELKNDVVKLRRQVAELEQYKNILDQHPICTIFYDTSEKIVYRNKATKLIDGYDDEELLGLSREEYLKKLGIKPGKKLDKIKLSNADSFSNGIFSLTETVLWYKGDIEKPVLLNGSFICDAEGNLLGACGCAQDMSNQVLKEKMFKLLADNARDLIYRFSYKQKRGGFEYVSPACTIITGYAPENFYNDPDLLFKITYRDDKPIVKKLNKGLIGSDSPVIVRLVHKNGKLIWTEGQNTVTHDSTGKIVAIEGIIRDITERKQMEEKLRKSEKFNRYVLDSLMSCIAVLDQEGNVITTNSSWSNLEGVEVNNGVNYTNILKKYSGGHISSQYAINGLKSVLEGFQTVFIIEHPWYIGNKQRWFLMRVTTLSGKHNGVVVSHVEITEFKQMQEALKSAQQDKEIVLESVSEWIVYYDLNMYIKWANKSAAKSSGMSPEQLVGRRCYEIWGQRSNPCPDCPVKKTFESGQFNEGEIITPDDTILYVKAYPVINDDHNIIGVVEVAEDITRHKQLEKEMARLERLNLIGKMAASIGHEVRNPMTTIQGFLQLLSEKDDCIQYKQYFNLMIEELMRANSIITQFLSLAKNKPINKELQNINDIVEDLYPFIQADVYRLNKTLDMKLNKVPDILLDDKEIRQLILNLVRNGLEAMFSSGTLTIGTYTADKSVVLFVQDQGSGIELDVLQKLGTPFLTTKDTGTGLGLAVCYSIASRHNARIKVDTGPNGTTFYVVFKEPQND